MHQPTADLCFYFVPQTGKVSMQPIASGNFYCFRLPTTIYREVGAALQLAEVGSGGLVYYAGFVASLHQHDLGGHQ